jgi:hypothetical protein
LIDLYRWLVYMEISDIWDVVHEQPIFRHQVRIYQMLTMSALVWIDMNTTEQQEYLATLYDQIPELE